MATSAYQEPEVNLVVKKAKIRTLQRMRSGNIAMKLSVRR
jgi:hypothetical protein